MAGTGADPREAWSQRVTWSSSVAPVDVDRPEGDAGPGDLVAQRYRLRTPLAHGATGETWLATDEDLERDVEVQRVTSTAGLEPGVAAQLRRRALRQGRAAAGLHHAHAVAVLDVAVDDGDPWLVTEHFPCRDLAGIVASHHVLPVAQVAQIGAQLADALVDVHAAGILHRGITPATVLVGEGGGTDGLVRIADLGLDRGEPTGTGSHLIRGTAAYVAPEVARGGRPTAASDVHALGATLFACLEGAPPHGLDDDADLLRHRIATDRHRAPTRAVALEPILLAMLDPDPAGRPGMADVRDELASIAAGRRRHPADVLTDRTHLVPISFAVVGIAAGVSTAAGAGDGGVTEMRAVAGATTVVAVPAPPTPSPRGGPVLRRRAAVAAALAAVATAGVAAYLAATSSAPAPAAGAATTAAVTTATATPAATTAATVAPPTAAESEQAVRALVSLLPADPGGALASAGPTLQAVGPVALHDYLAGVAAVTLEAVTARDGGTVTAGLVLATSDGRTRTEPVTFSVTRPTAAARFVVDSAPLAALVAAGGPATDRAAPATTTTTVAAPRSTTPARATASPAPPVRRSTPAPTTSPVPTTSPPAEVVPPTVPPTTTTASTPSATPTTS